MSFTHREPARKGAWVLVFVITLAYVAPIADGVTTVLDAPPVSASSASLSP